jgi:septum formation inhibitor-activating ATPase MinD
MIDALSISELLKIDIVGVVPDEDNIAIADINTSTKKKSSESYKAFSILANNLHNNTNILYDYKSKYRGIVGNFKRNLRRRM